MALNGSCLCGGIRYEVAGELAFPGHCHCSMCRKTHGAAFATYALAALPGFRWKSGEELLSKYESSPGNFRYFCSRCGSSLAAIFADDTGSVGIAMGTLDDDPGVRPMAHIFVGSKAPWHEITDSLAQFEAYPPGMGPAAQE